MGWRWRHSSLPWVNQWGCSSEVFRWLRRVKWDLRHLVVLADSRNRLERWQNDATACKLKFRGGSGGKVVREALHRSFYGGKSPSESQTTFWSLSLRESKINSWWASATERMRKIEELGQQKGNGPRSFKKLKYVFLFSWFDLKIETNSNLNRFYSNLKAKHSINSK
jgi:hypothetical protein